MWTAFPRFWFDTQDNRFVQVFKIKPNFQPLRIMELHVCLMLGYVWETFLNIPPGLIHIPIRWLIFHEIWPTISLHWNVELIWENVFIESKLCSLNGSSSRLHFLIQKLHIGNSYSSETISNSYLLISFQVI